MDYTVDNLYLVRDIVTGEGTYLQATEVLPYGHNTIVYGFLSSWETYIYRGRFEHTGRPTVVPVPGMNYGRRSLEAFALCLAACGADTNDGAMPFGKVRIAPIPPWVDLRTTPYKTPHPEYPEEPVYAVDRELANMWKGTPFKEASCSQCRGWGFPCQGHTPNRDGQVNFARHLLDIYDEVLRTGHIPLWFLDEYRSYLQQRMVEITGRG